MRGALLLDHDNSWLVKAIKRARALEAARTGLHLSTVLDDLVNTAYPPRKNTLSDGTTLPLQEFGNSLEAMVANELVRIVGWHKPVPRTKDGVTCSPDGVSISSGTLDEMKATWAQPTGIDDLSLDAFLHDTAKGYKYELQTDCYAFVWGLTRIRLHILFVRGVRGGAPLPTPVTIIRRRTPAQLRQTWKQMLQHARDRKFLPSPRRGK